MKSRQENLQIIRHHTNALHIKCRLIEAGVDKEVLNPFIEKYEKAVHEIIYWQT